MDSITISLLCIAIITVLFFTQYDIKKLNFEPKDASIILLVLAFVAYVNKYEKLFLLFLGIFILIYFIPLEKLKSFIQPITAQISFFKKEGFSNKDDNEENTKTKKKNKSKKKVEPKIIDEPEDDDLDNDEITIDDQISVLEDIDEDSNVEAKIEKFKNEEQLVDKYLNDLNKEYNT